MKVLVTGATGFVGSHIVRTLHAQDLSFRLLVRNQQKAEQFFGQRKIPVNDVVIGSVSDRDTVKQALEGCDAVVHAAAITPMQGASDAELFATNVDGVKNVVGLACQAGISQIVYVSSITAIFHTDAARVTENAAIAPSSHPYGKSKAQAETYIRGLQDQGHPVKVVYPGGIVGPDDPGMSATLMSLQYRFTQGFKVTSGGTQQIDVRDLAAIIIALLQQDNKQPGRYLTVGHYLPWQAFADLLETISGYTLEQQKIPGWFLRLVGRFYDFKRLFKPVALPISAETMRYATQWPRVENSAVLEELGVSLRTPEQTFSDTLRWMAVAGHVPAELLPRLSAQSGD